MSAKIRIWMACLLASDYYYEEVVVPLPSNGELGQFRDKCYIQ
jgi:hypothetical protein